MNKLSPELTKDVVAEFLSANPDFFNDRDGLLESMALAQSSGKTISLVERQLAILRDRNTKLRKKLDELVAAADQNNAIYEKCQRLVLGMVAAQSPDALFEALEQSFSTDFECAAYRLILFGNEPRQLNHFTSVVTTSGAEEFVASLLKTGKPTLGVLREAEKDYLFRHNSRNVGSAAILPLHHQKRLGVLAIGNPDSHYFRADLGTLFIGALAETLALLLPRHVQL